MHRRTPLTAAALALAVVALPASAQQAPVDVAKLAPQSLVYSISAMGNHIMDSTRDFTIEDVDGVRAIVVHNKGESGMMSQSTDLAVAVATFQPLYFTMNTMQGAMAMTVEMRVADGQVTGTIAAPGSNMEIDHPLPEGALLQGMEELKIMATDWATTDTLELLMFNPQAGGTVAIKAVKAGEETLTVPAGEFATYKLTFTGGPMATDLYVRKEAPHIVVRQAVPAQGVSIDLKEIRN